MQNHNEYLKQLEYYLLDLSVMERAKLLSEISEEISTKELLDLEDPLTFINTKRNIAGFTPYQEKQNFSFLRFFAKFFAFLIISSMLFVGFLVWKFTPLLKIDDATNSITILGGLIDIDGKSGKVKILDEVQFTEDKYTDNLLADFSLDQRRDEVILNFNSGQFTLKGSPTSELKLNCKLSVAADNKMLITNDDHILIDFTHIEGQTCEIQIPQDKKITLEGKEAAINIERPEFNTYIELEAGSVTISPEVEIDYNFKLDVKEGYTGIFNSSPEEDAYEIQISIGTGSIVTK